MSVITKSPHESEHPVYLSKCIPASELQAVPAGAGWQVLRGDAGRVYVRRQVGGPVGKSGGWKDL